MRGPDRLCVTSSMAGTKLFTEVPHSDAGSMAIKNHSDLLKKLCDFNHTVDKKSVNGQRRSLSKKNPTVTPVKKLIAKEMKKESQQRQKFPTVVTTLVQLDSLPMQQSVLKDRQNVELGYSCNGSAGEVRTCQLQKDAHFHNQIDLLSAKKEYKDVHEIWLKPSRANQTRDHSTHKEVYDENAFQKRMSMVWQKFLEEKRLAKGEKLLKSKEFQDAVEFLSLNRDLFLKYLEGPHSPFPKHHFKHSSVSSRLPEHITVLKSTTTIEVKSEKARENQMHEVSDGIVSNTWSCSFPWTRQPQTRIVVLKPSSAKRGDAKEMVSSSVHSPKQVNGQGYFGSLHTKEAMNSRELSKEITCRMRESLSGQIRDRVLWPSFLSNGYIGYDSSFNKTKSECIEEEVGRSDLDITSPTSQHSLDFLNRISTPHSVSSLSQTSDSPESSVVAEAKKRFSERLTELLAISETKKEESINDSSIEVLNEESHPDLGKASRFLSPGFVEDGCNLENSPRSLARSKSVPVSSFAYDTIESHVGSPNLLISGSIIQNDFPRSKKVKSSFTGKLSDFLFSRRKKQNIEATATSSSQNCDIILSGHRSHRKASQGSYHVNDIFSKESESISPDKTASCSNIIHDGADQDALSLVKLTECENCTQNQDQPRPISVLEAPFKDDNRSCSHQSSENVITGHPQALSRSPLIESVSRRVGSYLQTASLYPLKPSRVLSKVDEEKVQFMIVKKLISSAEFSSTKSNFAFGKWYSLEVPMNPMLLNEYIYSDDEEVNCRERRSNSRLMFDCTNVALLDISLKAILSTYPWGNRIDGGASRDSIPDASLSEEVCGIIRSWSFGENLVLGECSNISIVGEMMTKKEVTGMQWSESMWLERYEFSKEISWKLSEELIEEAISEFINGQWK